MDHAWQEIRADKKYIHELGALTSSGQDIYAPFQSYGAPYTRTESYWMTAHVFGERFLMGGVAIEMAPALWRPVVRSKG